MAPSARVGLALALALALAAAAPHAPLPAPTLQPGTPVGPHYTLVELEGLLGASHEQQPLIGGSVDAEGVAEALVAVDVAEELEVEQYRAVRVNRGAHGEIWRARRAGSGDDFVLKRVFGGRGLFGREAHFGERLRGLPHVARFVESFEHGGDLWLAFHDEGASLHSFLYERDGHTMGPSQFWRHLRTGGDGGQRVMRECMRQLLEALAGIADRHITHRDVKPSNVLINTEASPAVLKLADFSSAVDADATGYGAQGPSADEESHGYQPPERVFGMMTGLPQPSFDVWSAGVVGLEMVLGTPDVFAVSNRVYARLEHSLAGQPEPERARARFLAALAELCLYRPPGASAAGVAQSGCDARRFGEAVAARDPLRAAVDPWLTDLLFRLLEFDPARRVTAAEALRHAYFTGEPHACAACGREFGLPGEHNETACAEARRGAQGPAVVRDPLEDARFSCPQCARTFADWESCERHRVSRRHGSAPCEFPALEVQCWSRLDSTPRWAGFCDLQGRRQAMEDRKAAGTVLGVPFFAVYDGHMGSAAAEFAARRVHALVGASGGVAGVFELAHEEFLREHPGDESGTTATLLLLHPDRIEVANVGDSGAMLLHGSSSRMITPNHMAADAAERGFVEAQGGAVVDGRVEGVLTVARAIGDAPLAHLLRREPFVAELPREAGDVVVLATDGLWDALSPADAAALAEAAPSAQKAAEALVEAAYARGSRDNIGVFVLEV